MRKLVFILLVLILSACMTTKTNVGNYKETQTNNYTYATGKQVWLFWGLIPAGRTNVNTPKNGNCQVITRLNFIDFLISGFTMGFVTTETIKVKAKR